MIVTSLFLVACNVDTETSSLDQDSELVQEKSTLEKVVEKVKGSDSEAESYSLEVESLIKKSRTVTSYEYFFASSILNNFDQYDETSYDVAVKGEKVKKSYLTAVK